MPLSNLNLEQKEAVLADFGQNLVIASAGTGKTSTIVARIAHLLQKGVLPTDIVLLTFTNKAAGEMIERLGRYFPSKITSKITAGTFHSTAYKFLKQDNPSLVLKPASELKILLKSLMPKYDFTNEEEIIPYQAGYLYDLYQLCLSNNNHDFKGFLSRHNKDQAVFASTYAALMQDFESQKARFNYLDFNDLLIDFTKYLKNTNRQFCEILVDEYQDTNALQSELIDSFKSKSLFCVGDYDQSIYAFNGADIGIIANFAAKRQNAKVFSLKRNYRSSKSILALANKVILNNPRLYPKELIVTKEGDFAPPKLLVYDEINEQYKGVAKQVLKQNVALSEIAIIFRNNSSADGMEIALKEEGIKSQRKGSSSLFDSLEIKLFTAFLSIYLNPKDIMAFIHILEYTKGVGASAAKGVFDALARLGHGSLLKGFLYPDESVQINNSLSLFNQDLGLSSAFAKHPIMGFERLSKECAKSLEHLHAYLLVAKEAKSAQMLCKGVTQSPLFVELCKELALRRAIRKDGKIDEEKRKISLEKIYQRIYSVSKLCKNYQDAYKFYNFLSLGAKELSSGEGVQLLSVHAAKGLEFESVFVIDLAQDRFPNKKLMSMGGSLEEERRLFYVASTRAKSMLYLSYARSDAYKNLYFKPSCFLAEAGFIKQ